MYPVIGGRGLIAGGVSEYVTDGKAYIYVNRLNKCRECIHLQDHKVLDSRESQFGIESLQAHRTPEGVDGAKNNRRLQGPKDQCRLSHCGEGVMWSYPSGFIPMTCFRYMHHTSYMMCTPIPLPHGYTLHIHN